jgi:hypothetical protein
MGRGKPFDPVETAKKFSAEEMAQEAARQARKSLRTSREWKARALASEGLLELAEARIESYLAIEELHKDRRASSPIVIKPRKKSGKNEATAWAIASDWHIDEWVRPEQVNGLNAYSLQIAKARVDRFFHNSLRLIEIQRAGADIRELVLVLGGDFYSGHIHEDLVEITALSPTQSVERVGEWIEEGIRFYLEHGNFDRIRIPCVIGNHSRTTKKPRISTAQAHSLEWLMYRFLAKVFANEPRVQFDIAEGYHLMVDCYGVKVRVHHGDWLNYQGGVGGLLIPLGKALSKWNEALPADLDVLGHWHTYFDLPRIVVNSSLIGYSPYSIKIKAGFEPPTQSFFLIDAEHRRKTVSAPILVTESDTKRRAA